MLLNMVFKCVVLTWILGMVCLVPLHKKDLAGPETKHPEKDILYQSPQYVSTIN